MKKLFLILFLFLFTISGFAQPNIDYVNWGNGTNKDRYFVSNQKLSPNPVAPGNGVTWDFTNLTADPKDSILLTGIGGSTPFKFDFPTANVNFYEYHAEGDITLVRHYFKNLYQFDYQGAAQVGIGASPFSSDIKMFQFPFKFNQRFSNYFETSATDAGYAIVKYDGFGTLKLPAATHTGVFRTTNKDSISPTNIRYRYEWFDKDTRIMYMSVNTSATTITYLNNRPKSIGSIQSNILLEVKVFPNPGSGMFSVSLPTSISQGIIEITNIYGQVIIIKTIDGPTLTFNLEDKGMYLVSVYANNQKFVKKVFMN